MITKGRLITHEKRIYNWSVLFALFTVMIFPTCFSQVIYNPDFSINESLNDGKGWEEYRIPISSCEPVGYKSCVLNDTPGEVSISGGYAYVYSGTTGYCGEAGIKQTITLPQNTDYLVAYVEAYELSWGGYTGIKIDDDWLLKFHTPGIEGHHIGKGPYYLNISQYAGKTVDLKILMEDTSKRYCNMGDHDVWIKVYNLSVTLKRRPPCGNYGDLDKDGFVRLDDVLTLLEILNSGRNLTYEYNPIADVDGDGNLTSSDVQYIEQYISGYNGTFPVCTKGCRDECSKEGTEKFVCNPASRTITVVSCGQFDSDSCLDMMRQDIYITDGMCEVIREHDLNDDDTVDIDELLNMVKDTFANPKLPKERKAFLINATFAMTGLYKCGKKISEFCATCGNGKCESGENCANCPADCGSYDKICTYKTCKNEKCVIETSYICTAKGESCPNSTCSSDSDCKTQITHSPCNKTVDLHMSKKTTINIGDKRVDLKVISIWKQINTEHVKWMKEGLGTTIFDYTTGGTLNLMEGDSYESSNGIRIKVDSITHSESPIIRKTYEDQNGFCMATSGEESKLCKIEYGDGIVTVTLTDLSCSVSPGSTCLDECSKDLVTCSDDGRKILRYSCGDVDNDGCKELSDKPEVVQTCPEGQECKLVNGEPICVSNESCQDECPEEGKILTKCSEDFSSILRKVCGNYDEDPCLEWGEWNEIENCDEKDCTTGVTCEISGNDLVLYGDDYSCMESNDEVECAKSGKKECGVYTCDRSRECSSIMCEGIPYYCYYSDSGYEWSTSYPSKEILCSDGHDNDCDGRVDSEDPDCGIREEIENLKDQSAYTSKLVFIVSDEDWKDVLSLVPAAVWTSKNDSEWCTKGYGTAEDTCVYPVLIYHKEGAAFDADSIIYFLQQYGPSEVLLVGNAPQELINLLVVSPPLGAGLSKSQIKMVSMDDYIDFWKSFREVVYVENDYQKALLASTYASLINAPLIIQGSPLDKPEILSGKEVICVGNVGIHCNKTFSLDELEKEYVKLTNTNKIILVNPNDLDIKITETFEPEKSSSPVSEVYTKTSLAAPVLASAKHEIMIQTTLSDYQSVDSFIENKIEELGISNPEYLTIVAAPNAIQMTSGKGPSRKYSVDAWEYAQIDEEPLLDLAVGRIFGITISDVSSYIARDLFYDIILKNDDKILVTRGIRCMNSAGWVYTLGKVLSSIGYQTTVTPEGTKPDDWKNKMFIIYDDHGSKTWAGIPYYRIPYLDNTFIIAHACLTCAFDDVDNSLYNVPETKLFCANAIRRGAIGYIGAVDTAGYLNIPGYVTEIFAKKSTIGKAFLNSKNSVLVFDGMYDNTMIWYTLIGDPTLKLKIIHTLPEPSLSLIENNSKYKLTVPVMKVKLPKDVIDVCEYPADCKRPFYFTTAYNKQLDINYQFVVRFDNPLDFVPKSLLPKGWGVISENDGEMLWIKTPFHDHDDNVIKCFSEASGEKFTICEFEGSFLKEAADLAVEDVELTSSYLKFNITNNGDVKAHTKLNISTVLVVSGSPPCRYTREELINLSPGESLSFMFNLEGCGLKDNEKVWLIIKLETPVDFPEYSYSNNVFSSEVTVPFLGGK